MLCLWFCLFEISGFLVRFLSCHVMDVSAHETNTHVKLEMDCMWGLGCIIGLNAIAHLRAFCKVCQTWHLFQYGITFSYSIQIFCGKSLFSMDCIELISAYLTQCLSLEFPASFKKHHSHDKKNKSFFFWNEVVRAPMSYAFCGNHINSLDLLSWLTSIFFYRDHWYVLIPLDQMIL